MNKSETVGELAKALCKAQDEMGGAAKSSTNPFFKSSYSALPEVIKAIKQPFCNHGLSYSQFPVFEDGMAGVITILMHTSGEWLESKLLLPVTKKDPQATGSAITYARRYALQSIAGIPSEDDDGNAASAPGKIDPEMDLIKDAIKRGDSHWVVENWQGVIANKWGELNQAQTTKLNQMVA